MRRPERVREHLFAGDFYQANLTFGCDVAVAGDPLAIYARLRRRSAAGWGGVMLPCRRRLMSLSPEQFFTMRGGIDRSQADEGHRARRSVESVGDRGEAAELGGRSKSSAPKI